MAKQGKRGLRRILNYGHTYGHAVEGWHKYRVSHGQSVAAGMLVATEISRGRGLIEAVWAERITATVLAMAPRRFPLPDAAAAWPLMTNDKKKQTALDAFLARKFEIDDMLARLQVLSDDHFDLAPDEVNWAHVGDIGWTAEQLRGITDRVFNRTRNEYSTDKFISFPGGFTVPKNKFFQRK